MLAYPLPMSPVVSIRLIGLVLLGLLAACGSSSGTRGSPSGTGGPASSVPTGTPGAGLSDPVSHIPSPTAASNSGFPATPVPSVTTVRSGESPAPPASGQTPTYAAAGSATLNYGQGTKQFVPPTTFTLTAFVDSTTGDRNYDVSGANADGDVFDLFLAVRPDTGFLRQLSVTRPQEKHQGGLSYNFPLAHPADWIGMTSPIITETADHAYRVRITRDQSGWTFEMKRLTIADGPYSVTTATVVVAAPRALPLAWRDWNLKANIATDAPTTQFDEQFRLRGSSR